MIRRLMNSACLLLLGRLQRADKVSQCENFRFGRSFHFSHHPFRGSPVSGSIHMGSAR